MNVFDFAMKMELQGKAYYENIAASTELPGLKTIFTGLAADEQKHYDVIRELKEGKTWSMVDSAMLEKAQNVFTDMLRNKENLAELHEDPDAYNLGMKIEAESVKLYEDMAKKEQDPDTMQLYLRLANEEKKHYNILENVRDFVMRPKYFFKWSEATSSEDL